MKKTKPIQTQMADLKFCTFRTSSEELAKYKEIAGSMDRSVSWWIRKQLSKVIELTNGADLVTKEQNQ